MQVRNLRSKHKKKNKNPKTPTTNTAKDQKNREPTLVVVSDDNDTKTKDSSSQVITPFDHDNDDDNTFESNDFFKTNPFFRKGGQLGVDDVKPQIQEIHQPVVELPPPIAYSFSPTQEEEETTTPPQPPQDPSQPPPTTQEKEQVPDKEQPPKQESRKNMKQFPGILDNMNQEFTDDESVSFDALLAGMEQPLSMMQSRAATSPPSSPCSSRELARKKLSLQKKQNKKQQTAAAETKFTFQPAKRYFRKKDTGGGVDLSVTSSFGSITTTQSLESVANKQRQIIVWPSQQQQHAPTSLLEASPHAPTSLLEASAYAPQRRWMEKQQQPVIMRTPRRLNQPQLTVGDLHPLVQAGGAPKTPRRIIAPFEDGISYSFSSITSVSSIRGGAAVNAEIIWPSNHKHHQDQEAPSSSTQPPPPLLSTTNAQTTARNVAPPVDQPPPLGPGSFLAPILFAGGAKNRPFGKSMNNSNNKNQLFASSSSKVSAPSQTSMPPPPPPPRSPTTTTQETSPDLRMDDHQHDDSATDMDSNDLFKEIQNVATSNIRRKQQQQQSKAVSDREILDAEKDIQALAKVISSGPSMDEKHHNSEESTTREGKGQDPPEVRSVRPPPPPPPKNDNARQDRQDDCENDECDDRQTFCAMSEDSDCGTHVSKRSNTFSNPATLKPTAEWALAHATSHFPTTFDTLRVTASTIAKSAYEFCATQTGQSGNSSGTQPKDTSDILRSKWREGQAIYGHLVEQTRPGKSRGGNNKKASNDNYFCHEAIQEAFYLAAQSTGCDPMESFFRNAGDDDDDDEGVDGETSQPSRTSQKTSKLGIESVLTCSRGVEVSLDGKKETEVRRKSKSQSKSVPRPPPASHRREKGSVGSVGKQKPDVTSQAVRKSTLNGPKKEISGRYETAIVPVERRIENSVEPTHTNTENKHPRKQEKETADNSRNVEPKASSSEGKRNDDPSEPSKNESRSVMGEETGTPKSTKKLDPPVCNKKAEEQQLIPFRRPQNVVTGRVEGVSKTVTSLDGVSKTVTSLGIISVHRVPKTVIDMTNTPRITNTTSAKTAVVTTEQKRADDKNKIHEADDDHDSLAESIGNSSDADDSDLESDSDSATYTDGSDEGSVSTSGSSSAASNDSKYTEIGSSSSSMSSSCFSSVDSRSVNNDESLCTREISIKQSLSSPTSTTQEILTVSDTSETRRKLNRNVQAQYSSPRKNSSYIARLKQQETLSVSTGNPSENSMSIDRSTAMKLEELDSIVQSSKGDSKTVPSSLTENDSIFEDISYVNGKEEVTNERKKEIRNVPVHNCMPSKEDDPDYALNDEAFGVVAFKLISQLQFMKDQTRYFSKEEDTEEIAGILLPSARQKFIEAVRRRAASMSSKPNSLTDNLVRECFSNGFGEESLRNPLLAYLYASERLDLSNEMNLQDLAVATPHHSNRTFDALKRENYDPYFSIVPELGHLMIPQNRSNDEERTISTLHVSVGEDSSRATFETARRSRSNSTSGSLTDGYDSDHITAVADSTYMTASWGTSTTPKSKNTDPVARSAKNHGTVTTPSSMANRDQNHGHVKREISQEDDEETLISGSDGRRNHENRGTPKSTSRVSTTHSNTPAASAMTSPHNAITQVTITARASDSVTWCDSATMGNDTSTKATFTTATQQDGDYMVEGGISRDHSKFSFVTASVGSSDHRETISGDKVLPDVIGTPPTTIKQNSTNAKDHTESVEPQEKGSKELQSAETTASSLNGDRKSSEAPNTNAIAPATKAIEPLAKDNRALIKPDESTGKNDDARDDLEVARDDLEVARDALDAIMLDLETSPIPSKPNNNNNGDAGEDPYSSVPEMVDTCESLQSGPSSDSHVLESRASPSAAAVAAMANYPSIDKSNDFMEKYNRYRKNHLHHHSPSYLRSKTRTVAKET